MSRFDMGPLPITLNYEIIKGSHFAVISINEGLIIRCGDAINRILKSFEWEED